jgi:hypothetical protein
MKAVTGSLLTALAMMIAFGSDHSRTEPRVAEAEHHLRKACGIVWASATPYKIQQCTRRAMAALGDENRLRDNELKRLLIASEQELQTCEQELGKARSNRADVADARR